MREPTGRWVLTCIILGITFTVAHSVVVYGITSGLENLATDDWGGLLGFLGPSVMFVFCGVLGAPFFGAFWTGLFLYFQRRLRYRTGHCPYCGWKVRSGLVRCWICGTPYAGLCRCGYNLTGNVSGTCPECGTKV